MSETNTPQPSNPEDVAPQNAGIPVNTPPAPAVNAAPPAAPGTPAAPPAVNVPTPVDAVEEADEDSSEYVSKKEQRAAAKADAVARKKAAQVAALREKELARQAKKKARTKNNNVRNNGGGIVVTKKGLILGGVGLLAVGGLIAGLAIAGPSLFSSPAGGQKDPNGKAYPTGASGMGKPLVFGDTNATDTVGIWLDFHGLYAKEHQVYAGNFVQEAVKGKTVRVEYYMTHTLDQTDTEGSLRAANASLCAQNQGKFFEFLDYALDHQPVGFADPEDEENFVIPDGYTNKQLVAWGKKIDIPNQNAYETCIKDLTYKEYVNSITTKYAENGFSYIPVLTLNGNELVAEDYRLDNFAAILGVPWVE